MTWTVQPKYEGQDIFKKCILKTWFILDFQKLIAKFMKCPSYKTDNYNRLIEKL